MDSTVRSTSVSVAKPGYRGFFFFFFFNSRLYFRSRVLWPVLNPRAKDPVSPFSVCGIFWPALWLLGSKRENWELGARDSRKYVLDLVEYRFPTSERVLLMTGNVLSTLLVSLPVFLGSWEWNYCLVKATPHPFFGWCSSLKKKQVNRTSERQRKKNERGSGAKEREVDGRTSLRRKSKEWGLAHE